MYCDTYCQGRDTEVDCEGHSGTQKEECIKSCLDCRSPNKKYCYCPQIFPPKPGQTRSLQSRIYDDFARLGRDRDDEDFALHGRALANEGETEEPEPPPLPPKDEEASDDTIFYVSIIVAILVIAILLAIFCLMRYNKRKKAGMEQSQAAEDKSSRPAQMEQSRPSSKGHHHHHSSRNRDGSP